MEKSICRIYTFCEYIFSLKVTRIHYLYSFLTVELFGHGNQCTLCPSTVQQFLKVSLGNTPRCRKYVENNRIKNIVLFIKKLHKKYFK